MTISVKVLAEPATCTAEIVVQQLDNDGNVVSERARPMAPGYMQADYVYSHQRIVIREVLPK